MATVLEGLRFGFKLGFSPSQSLKPAKRNKPSAYEHPSVIDEYLATEVSSGRVAGPFASPPVPLLHVSSFGVIPKKGQRGKWRLIVDLSSPGGASVNDGINPDEFTLHNTTVDQFIRMVSQFGQGALMAKFDVEAAYQNIAIHPSDRFLLGMKWRSKIHVDLALPFRLRSAPYIFNCVAELVEWILVNNYKVPDFLHYLDDFITAGPPDPPQCAQNLSTVLLVCDRLGLPLHPGKCVGHTPLLAVQGIELDSLTQVAHLPGEKLQSLKELIHSWLPRKGCFRRKLELLIGHLHHAAKVVWPGRTSLHRMIDLLSCFRKKDHPIQLNKEFHLDLQWWDHLLAQWHGVSFWLYPGLSPAVDLHLMLPVPLVWGPTSPASGSQALGLFLNSSNPSPTRNFFPWWWKHMSGARSGVKSMSCFVETMRPWSTC